MGTIEKGVILTLGGEPDRNDNYTKATVQATSAEGTPTLPLVIPWYLRGSMGMLQKGTEIIYALFEDESGILLSRADGNWNGKLEEQELILDTLGKTAKITGNVDISESIEGDRVVSRGIVLSSHRHKNMEDSDTTDIPVGGE
ncbi:MAG: hypothetical protein NC231_12235 [Bacillus sp. (in: Bacteria)]|nr:hypothetical protein [Bacillus sp. (in: firmicutes)]MCM1427132.1 pre-mRNA-splicing factor [Eubacterium sp.]